MAVYSYVRISDKWFSKKILCGIACNYGCCNSQSFQVEFSKDEIEYLGTEYNREIKPVEYQNGKCKYLNGNGCSFGDDKPKYCKTYPITENKNETLVLSNWSWLHCPKPNDYILDKVEDGKWYYRLKKKHKNKRNQVILNGDIESTPTFFEREDIKEILNER